MPDARFQVQIRGAIADVWQEITRTDAPIAAFFNSRMDVRELSPGARLAPLTPAKSLSKNWPIDPPVEGSQS